ncbi:hypothetical protein GCM10022222_05020 [Amycolatopsis ultiminotia]|uniref:Capsule synthesis protein CapA domain-containing protein n=1 Tax=Amycolatopsis ultiminotia TaxID=543629 RepID=A0ABP6V1K2_9PSEU
MKLVVVGDTVPTRKPGSGARALLAEGAPDTENTVTLANLETPLTDSDEPAEKEMTIRAPAAAARHLRDLGIDVVSVATNHALDHGAPGLLDTVAALDRSGVRHAGGGPTLAAADAGAVLETADGTRLAVLSFCSTLPPGANATSTRPGIAPIRIDQSFAFDGTTMQEQPGTPPYVRTAAHEPDLRRAEERIRATKAICDRVVVCLHWGVPWCYLPENQGPLAEYQRPLAHRLVDAGADVVAGTHPHCLHPVERRGNGLILYSAGNFLFQSAEIGEPEQYYALPYRNSRLFTGRWFESAVFTIDLGDRPGLRLTPITLDEDGDPSAADEVTGARILRSVERQSRELDPEIRIGPDGVVHFGRGFPSGPEYPRTADADPR